MSHEGRARDTCAQRRRIRSQGWGAGLERGRAVAAAWNALSAGRWHGRGGSRESHDRGRNHGVDGRSRPFEREGGFSHENEHLAALFTGSTGGLLGFLLFRVGDRVADIATTFLAEGELEGRGQREDADVLGEHASPRADLHDIPMTAGGQEPRSQSEEQGDFSTHGPGVDSPSVKNQAFSGRATTRQSSPRCRDGRRHAVRELSVYVCLE